MQSCASPTIDNNLGTLQAVKLEVKIRYEPHKLCLKQCFENEVDL